MLQKMISSGFIKQMEDPLIFCGLDTLKTIQLQSAIQKVAAQNHVFYPLIYTDPERLHGHG